MHLNPILPHPNGKTRITYATCITAVQEISAVSKIANIPTSVLDVMGHTHRLPVRTLINHRQSIHAPKSGRSRAQGEETSPKTSHGTLTFCCYRWHPLLQEPRCRGKVEDSRASSMKRETDPGSARWTVRWTLHGTSNLRTVAEALLVG